MGQERSRRRRAWGVARVVGSQHGLRLRLDRRCPTGWLGHMAAELDGVDRREVEVERRLGWVAVGKRNHPVVDHRVDVLADHSPEVE